MGHEVVTLVRARLSPAGSEERGKLLGAGESEGRSGQRELAAGQGNRLQGSWVWGRVAGELHQWGQWGPSTWGRRGLGCRVLANLRGLSLVEHGQGRPLQVAWRGPPALCGDCC